MIRVYTSKPLALNDMPEDKIKWDDEPSGVIKWDDEPITMGQLPIRSPDDFDRSTWSTQNWGRINGRIRDRR